MAFASKLSSFRGGVDMSKRNIRKPQEFGGKELEGFFMVSMKDGSNNYLQ